MGGQASFQQVMWGLKGKMLSLGRIPTNNRERCKLCWGSSKGAESVHGDGAFRPNKKTVLTAAEGSGCQGLVGGMEWATAPGSPASPLPSRLEEVEPEARVAPSGDGPLRVPEPSLLLPLRAGP